MAFPELSVARRAFKKNSRFITLNNSQILNDITSDLNAPFSRNSPRQSREGSEDIIS